uniref:Uncharacterized protein LOC114344815 n=1 Tax=Diabrotica virgifera virgifera TaxID=50390 RepID=A0A6P7H147_DIAVI
MPLTREKQLEIRSAADVSIKQLCQDQTFIKSIVDSVSAGIVQILNSKLDVYEKKIDDLKTEITKIKTDHEVEIQTIKASLIDLNKKGDSFDMIKITTELNQIKRKENSIQCNKIKNIHGKILDLIVTPSVFSCEVTPEVNALVPIDYHHPALTCYFPYEVKEDEYFVPNQKRLNFRKYNVNKFNKLLTEMDWSHLKHFSDVDSAVDSFSLSLQEIIDKCVPLSSTRSQKYPAWFTSEIIAKVKRKHHYLRMYRRSKYCFYLQRAKDLRKTIKLEIQLEYKKFIERSQNSFKSDARQFWNFVNAKNNKSRIPGLMKYGSDKFTTSQDIVNAFANFFKSVYISDSNSSPSVTSYFNYNPSSYFNIGKITSNDIIEGAKKLKNKFSCGPDNFPVSILKCHVESFIEPLVVIFNLILKTTTFPTAWKNTRVCPIFKAGVCS